MRNKKGRFISGQKENLLPLGTIRVRTRKKRNNIRRAFIKTAQPNTWILLAHYIWRQHHGDIPSGMSIHHKDRNTLNDDITNLELLSKAQHLAEHRCEFQEKAIASFVKTRRLLRWSTKSTTKRTGRPPSRSQTSVAIEDLPPK